MIVQIAVGDTTHTIALGGVECVTQDHDGLTIFFVSGKRLRLLKEAAEEFIRQTNLGR